MDGREQQCLANDGRGSFLIAGHPRSLLVYLCIGLLTEIQESLSTVPQATSVPGPLCCAENGKEVIESINHFLDTQTYPKEKYDIAVAATQLSEEDLVTLLQMPVNIVVPDKEHCTKIYAIQQVMERYSPHEYDAITIFNSDNKIVPQRIRTFQQCLLLRLRCHPSPPHDGKPEYQHAVLNATSEEINNHLFRKAHTHWDSPLPSSVRA